MSLTIGWLITGGCAFILVIANLLRASMKISRGWQILLFASLSCGGLSMVCALKMVGEYVQEWLVDSLLDVAPTLTALSSWAACLGIALNLLALWLHLRAENRQKGAGTDGNV